MVEIPLAAHGAPLQRFKRLGDRLGIDLYVQRDDLLPFPLAGNKVRKIFAELEQFDSLADLLITSGGIDSNHCRTTAWVGALLGCKVALVLHGDTSLAAATSRSLMLYQQLGATFTIVQPNGIASRISEYVAEASRLGVNAHVIPGGCHTPSGARAYRDAAVNVLERLHPDIVFVPSGTGATQGGIAAAAEYIGGNIQVVGVSVARLRARGVLAVSEAVEWAGAKSVDVVFDDDFIAGGYGKTDLRTQKAVTLAWSYGLPLDGTYTGKAFASLLDRTQRGELQGSKVLFWHTGGLWNSMQELLL